MKKFLKENKGVIIFYAELVIITLIVLNNLQKGDREVINYWLFDVDNTYFIKVKYINRGVSRQYQLVNKNTMQIELKIANDVNSFFYEVSKKTTLTSNLKEKIKGV